MTGKFFLAETLWETGEKDRARKILKELSSEAPRLKEYFKDSGIIEDAKKKIKEIGAE